MSAVPAARVRVRRQDLGEPVLERMVSALGARVDMPLDRLSEILGRYRDAFSPAPPGTSTPPST